MKIRNLTPHNINVWEDDKIIRTYPSEGIARARQMSEKIGTLDGVEVVKMTFGEPVDLPDYEEGTCLIVSLITANAAKYVGRRTDDLLITADPVRDTDGQIVGCRHFAVV